MTLALILLLIAMLYFAYKDIGASSNDNDDWD